MSSHAANIGGMSETPRASRYGHVAQVLAAQIRRGDYRVGDELPPIATLAAGFDVSHMTAKEALRVLREQGVIQTGRGTRARVLTVPSEPAISVPEQLQAIRDRLHHLESRTSALEQHADKPTEDGPAEP